MKKYARLFSAVALTVTITFIFSGCGMIDYAKSLLVKENENTSDNSTSVSEELTDTYATESVMVVPPTESTTQDSTVTNTNTAATTTASQTAKPNSTVSTTSKNQNTTSSVIDDTPSVEEIEQMPVKDIQDLLFATEDAQTAANILNACGFEYDQKQGIYYSSVDPWQKNFGFNVLYDMAAPLTGMYYSTERVQFRYDNKDWMIQLWKGQYGITAGAEIGVYNKDDKLLQYDCVSEDEFLEMSFNFYNQGEYVFSRGPEKHWWLTGFKILNAGVPVLIDLDITIKFPSKSMADAFEAGLKKNVKNNLLDPISYKRSAKTFHIHW